MKNYSWLNADSRKFLKRGYLEGDESPEERIQTIADTAEKYLKIKGFSDKFTDYMSKGFYSLSSPIWSNFGKTRGLPMEEPQATSDPLGTEGLPYRLEVPRLVYITSLQSLMLL